MGVFLFEQNASLYDRGSSYAGPNWVISRWYCNCGVNELLLIFGCSFSVYCSVGLLAVFCYRLIYWMKNLVFCMCEKKWLLQKNIRYSVFTCFLIQGDDNKWKIKPNMRCFLKKKNLNLIFWTKRDLIFYISWSKLTRSQLTYTF